MAAAPCCPQFEPSLPFSPPQLMAFVAEERKRYTVYPPPDQVFTWTQMCDIRDVSRAAGAGEVPPAVIALKTMKAWSQEHKHHHWMFDLLSLSPK